MHKPEKVKDSEIIRKVAEKLTCAGIRAPSRVAVASSQGNITLTGFIQYEHQRHSALRAVKSVTGVQRVSDQMKVTPPRHSMNPPPRGEM